jgi:glycosyltransferase involved in cell wall biosynthesis
VSSPKISILLPCFNARSFLEERIESILAQSFSDWEAIVLDSHSTDGSWELFQSVAARDSRFYLYRIPREGLYAALNRGIKLTAGEFLHVATCDDTMVPEFLAALLEALAACPEAGIAACDVTLINRRGEPLTQKDMTDYLPLESVNDILALEEIRSYPLMRKMNYRTPPHDSLLHFSGKSVYLSLTQLLFRTDVARANGPFDTTVGSIADVGWLARLTNVTGTVHIPAKLAMWRFHGAQLSAKDDGTGLHRLKKLLERAAAEVYERHNRLLTRNDRAVLMLPVRAYLAASRKARYRIRFEACIRVLWMFCEKPVRTLRAMRGAHFSIATLKRTLIPMFFLRLGLAPREVKHKRIDSSFEGRNAPSPYL